MTGILEVENSKKEKKKRYFKWQFKKSSLTWRIESTKQKDTVYSRKNWYRAINTQDAKLRDKERIFLLSKHKKSNHLWQDGCKVGRGPKSGWPLTSQSNIQCHKTWMQHVQSSEGKNMTQQFYTHPTCHTRIRQQVVISKHDSKDSRTERFFLNKLCDNEIQPIKQWIKTKKYNEEKMWWALNS